jgi:hypothetical protein
MRNIVTIMSSSSLLNARDIQYGIVYSESPFSFRILVYLNSEASAKEGEGTNIGPIWEEPSATMTNYKPSRSNISTMISLIVCIEVEQ